MATRARKATKAPKSGKSKPKATAARVEAVESAPMPLTSRDEWPPFAKRFSSWLTEPSSKDKLESLLHPFIPVFGLFQQWQAIGREPSRAMLTDLVKAACACVPPSEIVTAEEALGSWVKVYQLTLPKLPRGLWLATELLFDAIRVDEQDVRFLLDRDEVRPHGDEFTTIWNEHFSDCFAAMDAEGLSFHRATGTDLVVHLIGLAISTAQYIGKHPPDHVVSAIAKARGINLAAASDAEQFLLRSMICRDPMLKGTPYDVSIVPATGWLIGPKEAALIASVLLQLAGKDVEGITVERGQVIDLKLADQSQSSPMIASTDGPAARLAAIADELIERVSAWPTHWFKSGSRSTNPVSVFLPAPDGAVINRMPTDAELQIFDELDAKLVGFANACGLRILPSSISEPSLHHRGYTALVCSHYANRIRVRDFDDWARRVKAIASAATELASLGANATSLAGAAPVVDERTAKSNSKPDAAENIEGSDSRAIGGRVYGHQANVHCRIEEYTAIMKKVDLRDAMGWDDVDAFRRMIEKRPGWAFIIEGEKTIRAHGSQVSDRVWQKHRQGISPEARPAPPAL